MVECFRGYSIGLEGMRNLKRSDIVDATLRPKRVDDLKPGMHAWIGRRCLWEVQWMIDEEDGGDYVGQYAMMPIREPGCLHREFPYIWVPLCDLEIHAKVDPRLIHPPI